MIHQQFKQKIMRRVWAIYFFRKATSPIAVQTYALSFLIWQLFVYVSMPHVLANMPSIEKPVELFNFMAASFVKTELVVQVLAVGTISLLIWLGRNIFRNISSRKQFLLSPRPLRFVR